MFDLPGPPMQFLSKKERADFNADLDGDEPEQKPDTSVDWDRIFAIAFFFVLLFAAARGGG